MRKFKSTIWGVLLVVVGVIVALNALEITNIDIFFDGWWTLFIIVPCFIGIFTSDEKFGSILGVAVGVFLLLCCQDILDFSMLWKLGLPVIIVAIGLKMIFGGLFRNKSEKVIENVKINGGDTKKFGAAFSGSQANFSGEIFYGTELNAIFGGVDCDLRGAFIEQDCVIKANAIFGGIDIYVPEGVNVKIHSTSIFGGVDNKEHKNSPDNPHTIFVKANCLFGGVDIK